MSRSYKITLLIALYVAQGLPFGFFTLALPVLLREAGFSLKAISALSLLSLPWVLKFLWASWLDHTGRRRTWLLTFQSASVIGALLLSQASLDENFALLMVAAFAFNVVAASQDVITDGLAVRMLDARERGLANAIQVGAYRVGMILGGGLLLKVFARTDWQVTFLCMAALLALTMIPAFALREPTEPTLTPKYTPAQLAAGWALRLVSPGILGFAAIIFLYRLGDQMVAVQSNETPPSPSAAAMYSVYDAACATPATRIAVRRPVLKANHPPSNAPNKLVPDPIVPFMNAIDSLSRP